MKEKSGKHSPESSNMIPTNQAPQTRPGVHFDAKKVANAIQKAAHKEAEVALAQMTNGPETGSLRHVLETATDTTETKAEPVILPKVFRDHPHHLHFQYLADQMRRYPIETILQFPLNKLYTYDPNTKNQRRLLTDYNTTTQELLFEIAEIGIAELQTYLAQIYPQYANLGLHDYLTETEKTYLALLYLKDPATAYHSINVFALGIELIQKCNVSNIPSEQWKIFLKACLIHDNGKTAVPTNILNFPGRPNREDAEIIERHEFESVRLVTKTRIEIMLTLNPPNDLDEMLSYIIARHHHYESTDILLENATSPPSTEGYSSAKDIYNPADRPPHCLQQEADFFTLLLFLADNFAALGENRPYREHLLPLPEIIRRTLANYEQRLTERNHQYLDIAAEENNIDIKCLLMELATDPDVIAWHNKQEEFKEFIKTDKVLQT